MNTDKKDLPETKDGAEADNGGVDNAAHRSEKAKKTNGKKDNNQSAKADSFQDITDSVSIGIKNSAENSLTVNLVKSIGRLDLKTKKSLFLSVIPTQNINTGFIKPIKRKVAEMKEESATFYFLNYLGKMLLSTRMSIFGILLLSFGLYSLGAAIILSFIESQSFLSMNYTNVITSTIVVLLSFILLWGGKKSLLISLCESRMMSYLLFSLLGIKEESLKKQEGVKPINALTAFILGMFFGIISMFISPLNLITRLVILIVAILIFIVPESGVVLTFIAIPFLSVTHILLLNMYVWICYAFKLLLGRRSFKLRFTDCCVLLLSFVTFITGIIFSYYGSWIDAYLYSGFMLSFVLLSTLIRSREWLNRCKTAVYISSTAIAVTTVFEWTLRLAVRNITTYIGDISIELPEVLMSDTSVVSVFDKTETLAVYLMIAVFFIISHYVNSKNKSSDLAAVFSFIACTVALIILKIWSVWLGFIVGFAVYIVTKNKKLIYYVVTVSILLVAALIFAPDEYIQSILSVCNFDIADIGYRIDTWIGSLRMAIDNLFGIGFSSQRFSDVYRQYAVSGAEGAEHSYSMYLQMINQTGIFSLLLFGFVVLLVIGNYLIWSKAQLRGDDRPAIIGHIGLCAAIAVLINGLFDNSLSHPSLFVLFYMVLGLVYSCCKIMRDEADDTEKEIETVYYFNHEKRKKR